MAHICHWPGCNVAVPPTMWGCKPHWFKLPRSIRQEIWRTYVPGQEETKNPSGSYIDAALTAQHWAMRQNKKSEVTSGDETFPPKRMKPDGSRF